MAFGNLSQKLTALEIYDLVRKDLEQVEKEIGLESISSVEAITHISQYLQTGGGKRLRPILVLLCGKLFGPANEALVRMGAVVEMIHTATLVHDDVIDMAKTRRGRPSINVVWGNHMSVLAGDWLYMQAFQVALRERQFALLDILIQLTQRMVEGELLQLDRIGKIGVTEADYMELIDRKTASLFAACAQLGAVCGGANAEQEAKLADYAWNLGIAFQLVDDILDFTSREKILGKPVGNDLREGKVTLPLIYALESADPEERKLVETVLADGNYDQVPFSKILHMLNRYNSIERAQQRAREFTEKAREILSEFPDSEFQRALVSVTGLVTNRDH
jgi:octaprenyl-diphosphate synthase